MTRLSRAVLAFVALAAVPAHAEDVASVASATARALATQELERLASEPESARRRSDEARLLHFLAEETRDEGERERIRSRGREVARRALALGPDDPAAILWWTAHRGSEASAWRPLEAIRIASELERTLLRLRELDPGYDHAAADRVLGHLYRVAPEGISVGSLEKSERHLRAALARSPTYPGNLRAVAELLHRRGRCAAARQGAKVVLASPELQRFPLERPGWLRGAKDLAARPCR